METEMSNADQNTSAVDRDPWFADLKSYLQDKTECAIESKAAAAIAEIKACIIAAAEDGWYRCTFEPDLPIRRAPLFKQFIEDLKSTGVEVSTGPSGISGMYIFSWCPSN